LRSKTSVKYGHIREIPRCSAPYRLTNLEQVRIVGIDRAAAMGRRAGGALLTN
jgi:hypothetical protein